MNVGNSKEHPESSEPSDLPTLLVQNCRHRYGMFRTFSNTKFLANSPCWWWPFLMPAQGHWTGRTHHELWILNQSFPIGSAVGGMRESFCGFSFHWHKIFRSWIVWIIQETGIGALSMEALSMDVNSGRIFHISGTKMSDEWWVVLQAHLCRCRSTSEPPHRDLKVKCQDSL